MNNNVVQIAIDESGHSGSNLIRPEEPILVLGSVSVTTDQITELEALFGPMQASEWKFSNFRRRRRYLELFCKFLKLDWVGPSTIQIYAIHKRYMAVAKLVDLLVEPQARRDGLNLHEQGGALAMTNLFYTTWPVFLGDELFNRLLTTFVDVVRKRTRDALPPFLAACLECQNELQIKDPEFAACFAPFIIACRSPDWWIDHLNPLELDPLVPAYFSLLEIRGRMMGLRFDVIADESKTLAQEIDTLIQFSDESLVQKYIPCPAGTASFPLKANSIKMVRSHDSRSVQLADLISGATNSVLSSLSNGEKFEPWQEAVWCFLSTHEVISGIWPSREVTPEGLGTTHVTGETPVDYSVRVFGGDPTIRKSST